MNAPQSTFRDLENQRTYRVVFWGETADGRSRSSVARAFAERFNVKSKQQLERLFSGKVVTLKRSLSATQAKRYIAAIQEVGGVCRMEGETNNYFREEEIKPRNTVSFLQNDVDMDALTLSPK